MMGSTHAPTDSLRAPGDEIEPGGSAPAAASAPRSAAPRLPAEPGATRVAGRPEAMLSLVSREGRALLRNVKGSAFKPSTPNLGPLEPPRWLGRTAMVLVTALALHTDYTHHRAA